MWRSEQQKHTTEARRARRIAFTKTNSVPSVPPWLAVAICLLAACHKNDEERAQRALQVQVAKVERGDVAEMVDVAGELSAPPGMDVKLGPLVAGRLGAVLVGEGDKVREGQLLARLDGTTLRDTLAQAEAQLAQARAQQQNAQARLSRAEKALEAGVAAAQEVEDDRLALAQAQAAVKTAQAVVSTARNQLGRSELRAPFDGVVARVFVPAGEPVDAGKPVVEVAHLSPIELRAPIAPRLAALLKPGQEAQLRVDALPARLFPARVFAVAPTVDAATGAALIRLRSDNKDGALRLGAFAHAQVVTDVHRGVLRVPAPALLGGEEGASVEVVEGGKARKVPVRLGVRGAQWAEVVEGVQEGAQVIVQGNYALPDGTPVQVQYDGGASETAQVPAK
ncbi:MAG: efflux RND transporter periplasmic adaptor subunit [Myxococcales bacterium]